MMNINKGFQEIEFKNVGRMDQYEVDLFKIGERPFDIFTSPTSQSFAEEQLTHIKNQVTKYLQENGFKSFRDKFKVVNGKIERCEDIDLEAKTLHEAIQDRDGTTGQSGIYLAAFVEYWCWRLESEWKKKPWENLNAVGWILDHVMMVQHYFFNLVLYEHQSVVSSGRKALQSCNQKAKKPRNGGRSAHIEKIKEVMRPYKKEEIPFKTFLTNAESRSFENLTITNNGKKYQVSHEDVDGPPVLATEETIRGWYSACFKKKSQK
jgi:hypothetical protein